MQHPQSSYVFNGQKIGLTWIKSSTLKKFSPIMQIYGICFNDKSEILICREKTEGKWQIPGGHPEDGETLEATLIRELEEETDVKVKNIKILGVQKVNYPNNSDKTEGEEFYQARLVCELDELLPQTPDPASGNVWERMFVPVNKVTKYIKWGSLGEVIFADAVNVYRSTKISGNR